MKRNQKGFVEVGLVVLGGIITTFVLFVSHAVTPNVNKPATNTAPTAVITVTPAK